MLSNVPSSDQHRREQRLCANRAGGSAEPRDERRPPRRGRARRAPSRSRRAGPASAWPPGCRARTPPRSPRRSCLPTGPSSTCADLRHERLPGTDLLDRDDVHEGQRRDDVDERHDRQRRAAARAASSAHGSRTSPAIFVTSHHPPNEKNAATRAPASAGPNGGAPDGARRTARSAASCRPRSRSATHTRPPMSDQLQHRQRRQHARARADPDDVHGRKGDDGGYGDHPESHRAERHDEPNVAGESPGERRGDSGIHDQEALPSVEECDAAVRTPRAGRRSRLPHPDSGLRARRSRARRTAPCRR